MAKKKGGVPKSEVDKHTTTKILIVFYLGVVALLGYGVLFLEQWMSFSGFNPGEKSKRPQYGAMWERFGFLLPWGVVLLCAVSLMLVPLKIQHGGKKILIESVLE